MKTSQQLLSFYKWYMGDRSVSNQTPNPFAGLCFNLTVYVSGTSTRLGEAEHMLYRDLKHEMDEQFLKSGLHVRFPFNRDSAHYEDEVREAKCMENPIRLAWVNQRISEGEL